MIPALPAVKRRFGNVTSRAVQNSLMPLQRALVTLVVAPLSLESRFQTPL